MGRPREPGSRQFGECDDAKLHNFPRLLLCGAGLDKLPRVSALHDENRPALRSGLELSFLARRRRRRRPKGSIKSRRGRKRQFSTRRYKPSLCLLPDKRITGRPSVGVPLFCFTVLQSFANSDQFSQRTKSESTQPCPQHHAHTTHST